MINWLIAIRRAHGNCGEIPTNAINQKNIQLSKRKCHGQDRKLNISSIVHNKENKMPLNDKALMRTAAVTDSFEKKSWLINWLERACWDIFLRNSVRGIIPLYQIWVNDWNRNVRLSIFFIFKIFWEKIILFRRFVSMRFKEHSLKRRSIIQAMCNSTQ